MYNGSQKYFDTAIIESGPAGYSLPKVDEFQDVFDDVVTNVGCKNSSSLIKCLKAVPAEILGSKKFIEINPFPVLDGVVLKQQPMIAIEKGLVTRVPLIIGTNQNEVSLQFLDL